MHLVQSVVLLAVLFIQDGRTLTTTCIPNDEMKIGCNQGETIRVFRVAAVVCSVATDDATDPVADEDVCEDGHVPHRCSEEIECDSEETCEAELAKGILCETEGRLVEAQMVCIEYFCVSEVKPTETPDTWKGRAGVIDTSLLVEAQDATDTSLSCVVALQDGTSSAEVNVYLRLTGCVKLSVVAQWAASNETVLEFSSCETTTRTFPVAIKTGVTLESCDALHFEVHSARGGRFWIRVEADVKLIASCHEVDEDVDVCDLLDSQLPEQNDRFCECCYDENDPFEDEDEDHRICEGGGIGHITSDGGTNVVPGVIGGVVFGLIILAVVGGALLWCHVRKKKKQSRKAAKKRDQEMAASAPGRTPDSNRAAANGAVAISNTGSRRPQERHDYQGLSPETADRHDYQGLEEPRTYEGLNTGNKEPNSDEYYRLDKRPKTYEGLKNGPNLDDYNRLSPRPGGATGNTTLPVTYDRLKTKSGEVKDLPDDYDRLRPNSGENRPKGRKPSPGDYNKLNPKIRSLEVPVEDPDDYDRLQTKPGEARIRSGSSNDYNRLNPDDVTGRRIRDVSDDVTEGYATAADVVNVDDEEYVIAADVVNADDDEDYTTPEGVDVSHVVNGGRENDGYSPDVTQEERDLMDNYELCNPEDTDGPVMPEKTQGVAANVAKFENNSIKFEDNLAYMPGSEIIATEAETNKEPATTKETTATNKSKEIANRLKETAKAKAKETANKSKEHKAKGKDPKNKEFEGKDKEVKKDGKKTGPLLRVEQSSVKLEPYAQVHRQSFVPSVRRKDANQ